MEESKFDHLLRKAVQQTTRRETVSALVGGALLLTSRRDIAATKQAERRKHRQRNAAVTEGIIVNFGYSHGRALNYSIGGAGTFSSCCRYIRDARLERSANATVLTNPLESAWLWLDDGKYWFHFTDPVIGKPWVQIAFNGRHPNGSDCCLGIPVGQSVERSQTFSNGQQRNINIAGNIFNIRRYDLRNYTAFTVTIPYI
jgi:hypothetical protein